MASKRLIKKQLNGFVNEVLDECFSVQLYDPKKTDATNKLIEEVLVFSDELLSKIHSAKSKKDYPAIRKSMDDKIEYFITQIEAVA